MYTIRALLALLVTFGCTIRTAEDVVAKINNNTPPIEPIQQEPPAAQTDSSTLKSSEEPPKQRFIKIKNGITPEMTQYRFWGSSYKPTDFYLSINGKVLKHGENIECPVDESGRVEITYHYDFKSGMVTGSKCIEFEIPQNEHTMLITFSWKDNYRLISNCGRAINSKKGTMKSSCSFI